MDNEQENDMTNILLLLILAAILFSCWRREKIHDELMTLLSDFATMVGDLFDMIEEK